jgi:hypothetical protein
MSRRTAFLAVSLPLHAVLVLLSFRGMRFDQGHAVAAQGILRHEYDYPLLWAYVGIGLILFAAWLYGLLGFAEMGLDRRSVLAIGAAVGFLSFCAYPGVTSNDIMAYVGFGRVLGVHHLNPWEHGYADVADFYSSYAWFQQPMPYGPVVAPIFDVAGRISELSVPLSFYFIKFCWLLALLGSGLAVGRIADALPPSSLRMAPDAAVWAVVCNPLLLLETVNNGHCDVLLALLGLLSLLALVRDRDGLAVFLSGLAILVKPTMVLLLAPELAFLFRNRLWRGALCGLAAFAAVSAGLFATVLASPVARAALTNPQELTNAYSFHSVIIHFFSDRYLLVYDAPSMAPVREAITVAFAGFCLWRLALVRTRADVVREYLWMTMGLMLFYSARVWPWYLAWVVPFAAVSDGVALRRAIFLWSGTILTVYAVPFRLVWPSVGWHLIRLAVSNVIPLIWLALGSPLPARRPPFTASPPVGI